jgi:hypothetical protein
MKKVISTLAIAFLAASAFAQGTINFQNNASSLVTLEGGASFAANSGRVQLMWAPTGTPYTPWSSSFTADSWLTANAGWTLIGTPANIAPVAGRFNGGVLTAATATPGATISAVVVGWNNTSTTFQQGYATALAAGLSGQVNASGVFSFTTGNPTTIPAGTPALITPAFTGFSLAVVPEPSSFALAGLGAAALLIFRRRK